MNRLLLSLLALLLVVAPVAAPVAAHQQKIAISSVEHNPRTQMLEVIHRIPLHDAEHALRTQGIRAPDIIGDRESRRALARYVAKRFSLEIEGEPIALTILGTEIDGGNLVVYQEARSPGLGTQLSVQSQILTDVWARQVNRVNVGPQNSPTTLVFRQGDAAKDAILS